MTDFCSIANPSQLTGQLKAYRVKKTSDSGHTRVRPQGGTPRNEWELTWGAMTASDFSTLQTFFDANYAEEFNWTHPTTSATHAVFFSSDELSYEYVHVGHWKVSFKIMEA